MSAPVRIDTARATPRFTADDAMALIGVCDREIGRRQGPVEPWRIAEMRHFMGELNAVRWAAFAVLDNLNGFAGFEDAHDELDAALQEIDFYPFWTTLAQVRRAA